MYTGRMIEELIESVQRAEQHAHVARSAPAEPMVEFHPVADTFIYNFSYNQELVGVA